MNDDANLPLPVNSRLNQSTSQSNPGLFQKTNLVDFSVVCLFLRLRVPLSSALCLPSFVAHAFLSRAAVPARLACLGSCSCSVFWWFSLLSKCFKSVLCVFAYQEVMGVCERWWLVFFPLIVLTRGWCGHVFKRVLAGLMKISCKTSQGTEEEQYPGRRACGDLHNQPSRGKESG